MKTARFSGLLRTIQDDCGCISCISIRGQITFTKAALKSIISGLFEFITVFSRNKYNYSEKKRVSGLL